MFLNVHGGIGGKCQRGKNFIKLFFSRCKLSGNEYFDSIWIVAEHFVVINVFALRSYDFFVKSGELEV